MALRAKFVVIAVGLACSTQAFSDNRTMNGTGNNLSSPMMGSTGTELLRGPSGCFYDDGIGSPMPRPNPRLVSNALSDQTPAGLGNARNLSSFHWQWGQFIDHDFALVDESAETMNIPIPMGDPVFDPMSSGTASMPFTRSVYHGGTSTVDPRQQSNVITHWLDGSMVYGSDDTRAGVLRSHIGGRLATSAGNMLPYNTTGQPNAGGTGSSLFLAGDIRSNEQTGLTAMHTLFVREHNRLADLVGAANPGWTDEQVYQKTRKLVGAEVQAITYNEWLPALLGGHGLGSYAGYNAGVDSTLNTAFSTAAFRIGHSMLNDQLLRLNEDGTTFAGGNLNLFQQFFNPTTITGPGSLDAVLRGMAAQQANEVDTQAISGVRNLLFGGTDGRDLIAINLQRGRDHGLPDYNSMREDYGLTRVTNFAQITSDPALASALASVYGDVDHIDAWIGLFAEDHLPGASVGLTTATIFNDQFGRLRDGDRYFYLNDGDLTLDDLSFIESVKLSDIIRWNSDVMNIQDNVFFAVPAPGAASLLALAGLLATRRRRSARQA